MSSFFLSGSFRPFFFSVSFVILCPVRKSYGPVCKKHEMRPFAHQKKTYNEAIFDLWQKKNKIYVKIGYSGYDSGNKFYWL